MTASAPWRRWVPLLTLAITGLAVTTIPLDPASAAPAPTAAWSVSDDRAGSDGVEYTVAITTTRDASIATVVMTVPDGTKGGPKNVRPTGVGAGSAELAEDRITFRVDKPTTVPEGTVIGVTYTAMRNTDTVGTYRSIVSTADDNEQVDAAVTNPVTIGGTPFVAYVGDRDTSNVRSIELGGHAVIAETSSPSPGCITLTPDGRTALVCNRDTDTVTPIEVPSMKPGKEIVVGTRPEAIAVAPDGRSAYVANAGSNSVTRLDLDALVATGEIKVGKSPIAIAVSVDGTSAYVANHDSSSVTVLDLDAFEIRADFGVGSRPSGISLSPDGTMAYVINHDDASISPIDLTDDTVGTPVDIGSAPSSIAVTPDGVSAYVTRIETNDVVPVALPSMEIGAPVPVGTSPVAVAITPDGSRALILNEGSRDITPIAVATNTPLTPTELGGNPSALAVSPDQAPVAAFETSTAALGEPTGFDASATTSAFGIPDRFEWDFGDGAIETTSTPTTTHVYQGGGNYEVTLTVTNSSGTSLTDTSTGQQVLRNGGPDATATRTVVVALGWVTAPGDLNFSTTLTGHDQTVTSTVDVDVGSGSITTGWNITATSTSFSGGGHRLPATATTITTRPGVACDDTCTEASTTVSYPYTLPAGKNAPTATKLFNAVAGTGNGNQTITPNFTLRIPANAYAGVYTSTWTISLESGP